MHGHRLTESDDSQRSVSTKDSIRSRLRRSSDGSRVSDFSDSTTREPNWKRVSAVFVPQILVFFLFFAYIFLGAITVQYLDESLAEKELPDLALFCFTTLATIGYGNISPSSRSARLFCIAYATLGIPLCVAVLGNLSKYLNKAYWMVLICFGSQASRRPLSEDHPPLKVVLLLYFVVFMFGCLLYPPDQETKSFTLRNLYFSVVSFATVGFGDESPETPEWTDFFPMLVYIIFGTILSTMLFAVFHQRIRKVHNLGMRVHNAQNVVVWFGTKPIKVSKLLETVAKEFEAKPAQIHHMLHGLDDLIDQAVTEMERKSNEEEDCYTSGSDSLPP